jgi:hypothetical protein
VETGQGRGFKNIEILDAHKSYNLRVCGFLIDLCGLR